MGFVATEAVQALTYDFRPHADVSGTIPEPTTAQVDHFRSQVFTALKSLGLTEEQLQTGKVGFEQLDSLMEKGSAAEAATLAAVADLTGIPDQTIQRLPHRIKVAFAGWIVGMFLSPEA